MANTGNVLNANVEPSTVYGNMNASVWLYCSDLRAPEAQCNINLAGKKERQTERKKKILFILYIQFLVGKIYLKN